MAGLKAGLKAAALGTIFDKKATPESSTKNASIGFVFVSSAAYLVLYLQRESVFSWKHLLTRFTVRLLFRIDRL